MCEIEHVFGMVTSHWQLVNADVDDDQRWLCVHLCYKHTERNITLMDITSKRNGQGTDITSKEECMYRGHTHKTSLQSRCSLNQFAVHIYTLNVQGLNPNNNN